MAWRGIKTLVRRFLVLAALLFWQGGFLFYSSVVVPIGQEVLTSGITQGFITRRVAVYLNSAGAVALFLFLWDNIAARDENTLRKSLRGLAWMGLAVTLAILAWLHPRLDLNLNADLHVIEDMKSFRPLHRWYLWTSTVQWFIGLAYTFLMLWAWRDEDRRAGLSE